MQVCIIRNSITLSPGAWGCFGTGGGLGVPFYHRDCSTGSKWPLKLSDLLRLCEKMPGQREWNLSLHDGMHLFQAFSEDRRGLKCNVGTLNPVLGDWGWATRQMKNKCWSIHWGAVVVAEKLFFEMCFVLSLQDASDSCNWCLFNHCKYRTWNPIWLFGDNLTYYWNQGLLGKIVLAKLT